MNDVVFVDTDVILDLLKRREPFYDDAAEIFTRSDNGQLDLRTTAIEFANIFYLLRKSLGSEAAQLLLRKLRTLVHVLPTSEKSVDLALNSDFSDFEDALQYFSAREHGISILITRNTKDYKERDVRVVTPREYLSLK